MPAKQRRVMIVYIEIENEWNSHTRGAQIAIWLKDGARLTTDEIAERIDITTQGVDYIMDWLCLKFPIHKVDGTWQWLQNVE